MTMKRFGVLVPSLPHATGGPESPQVADNISEKKRVKTLHI